MIDWLKEHPNVTSVRALACDLNGQARAKRLPRSSVGKIHGDGVRMPFSVLNLDIFGHDIEGSPLVFDSGDQDGVLRPTERGLVPAPWLTSGAALIPMWMFDDKGKAFAGDPRHALAAVVARYTARGWSPVVATELEFFLVDDSQAELSPAPLPRSGKRITAGEILSARMLDEFDEFFNDLYDGCAAMGIDADAAISEGGAGQFEINLMHTDAMRAADDSWLFKQLVRGLARKHGFAATFMAKPFAQSAGTGMHTHFSVLDAQGDNVFDNGTHQGSDTLRAAIAGCLQAMPGSTLILAPHANSYTRFEDGSHAPNGIGWGYENRTTAIRVPGGSPKARRIEHRVAGGDINPYLMLAVILGAALTGIEDGLTAPDPIKGNAYSAGVPKLPTAWSDAIKAFETSADIARILPPELIANYLMTKRQELACVSALSPSEQNELYLETV